MIPNKPDLGNWEPKRKKREFHLNELRDTNRTLWTVAGSVLVIFFILVISFFSVAHFFPSLFFFGSEERAAVMNGKEITMKEYQYYLIQAAEEPSLTNPDYSDKKTAGALQKRALELLQTDRLYSILAEELELIPQADNYARRCQKLNEYETARNTPLFQFQMQSYGLTEELARLLILAESDRETVKEYAMAQIDSQRIVTRAKELYEKSYRKIKWIRFSLTDEEGNPLSQEEKEKVRVKSYSVYQELQSGTSFLQMQQSLSEEPGISCYNQLATRGQLETETEKEAFSLEIDEISEPIETEQEILLMQRVDASESFASQEEAMMILAQEQLLEEWLQPYRKEYSLKPYNKNLKKFDIPSFLKKHYKQKEEADKQIEWMEKSK